MARILAAFLVVACVLAGGLGHADTSRLGLRLRNKTSGDELPAIVLNPSENVKSVVVNLTRDDGEKQKLSASNLASGEEKVLKVKQDYGEHSYDASFNVKWDGDETSQFTMKFTMLRVKKLELDLKPEDVDLDKREMSFTINNPAEKAELIFVDDTGATIKTVTESYNGAAAGTKLELKWKDPGEFVYMDLKVYDTAGFWKGVRLTPFSISIPHDDVEFDNGKYDIRKSEEPKLKKALDHLKEELAKLEKHGAKLPLRLYIAGYTDTVGSKASNKTLSNNRAKSIASWFRKKGIKLPISYQGFGEEVLAVDTPDETPEPRNRRALYLLATQTPPKSKDFPKTNWTAL
jgi:outer membrane protein OmpA-like peptidoglycan-associated protein